MPCRRKSAAVALQKKLLFKTYAHQRLQADTKLHILSFRYSFTCERLSDGAAIGLPVWLLSYYQTEVVAVVICER